MDFGQRIRTARDAAGLTQKQVADHFGIKRPTVTQWEAGPHRPDQDRFPALAALLGITLDWLMTEVGDRPDVKRTMPAASVVTKFLR
jgi:transcriptional regulator with XRE-family HTH domain